MSELPSNHDRIQDPNMRPDDPYAYLWESSEEGEDDTAANTPAVVGSLLTPKEVDYTVLLVGNDDERIEPRQLTPRQRRLFAPRIEDEDQTPAHENDYLSLVLGTNDESSLTIDAARRGKSMDGRWAVTEQSERAAISKLAMAASADYQVGGIVDAYRARHDNINFADVPEAIRTDDELRGQLAEHFLAKVDAKADAMPDRVRYNDRLKRPTITGYEDFKDMTSREYAVLLALAKVDGTFKPNLEETDPVDRTGIGDGVFRGQHRVAADILLDHM